MSKTLWLLAASVLVVASCRSTAPSPPSPPSAEREVAGFYSAAQATRGRASYVTLCRECHPTSQFRGADFEWKWRRQTAWELYREVSTNMPENQPGSLSAEDYADIVAYLLSLNDYQAGSSELAATREALSAIPLGAGVEKTRSKE